MLLLVFKAISSGDEAFEKKLGVVTWVPLRGPVGKLLFPESMDKREGDIEVPIEILAVVVWVPLWDPLGTLLRRDGMACGSNKTEERVDRVEEGSTDNG